MNAAEDILPPRNDSDAIPNSALAALNRSEIDIQISTAKRYPRSIQQAKAMAMTMATIDQETAQSCFYKLPRNEKKEDGSFEKKWIEGPSVRLAEIFASAWGNMRFGARVIAEDDRFVVAQGIAHDLQTNVAFSVEKRRRITNKFGKKYNDDMIGVTSNAACSIAARDAIFRVIPKCYVNAIFLACKKVAVGDAKTLATRRADLLAYLTTKMTIPLANILAAVGRKGVEDIDLNDMENLHGLATAVRDGETSIEDAFPPPVTDQPDKTAKPADAAASLASELKGKPEKSEAGAQPAPATEAEVVKTVPETVGGGNGADVPSDPDPVVEAMSQDWDGARASLRDQFKEHMKITGRADAESLIALHAKWLKLAKPEAMTVPQRVALFHAIRSGTLNRADGSIKPQG